MNNLQLKIGAIIRNYRIKSNLTQLQLANKLGYDNPQFVSLFERGMSKVPANVVGKLIQIINLPEKKVTELLIEAYKMQLKEEILLGKKAV